MAMRLGDVIGSVQRITFKGEPFLLVPGFPGMGAAIATPEQYEEFETSYAHLYPDGTVKRCGQQVGTKADIEVLGPYEGDDD